MPNTSLIKNLQILLANNYALSLKTQNFHWNVTGPNFKSLHLLFEEQYNDLFMANDLIAERIRILGAKVPANFKEFELHQNIKDGDENYSCTEMLKELVHDQDVMIKVINNALEIAKKNDDEATISILTDRIEIHQKNAWMLQSSI
jgi:starvation-inducible DNA-binding protein